MGGNCKLFLLPYKHLNKINRLCCIASAQVICSNSQQFLVLDALLCSIDCFSAFAEILSVIFWLLARQIFTVYKYFKILHSDLYFFFKQPVRYQIQEQAIFTFAQRRLLGKLFSVISFLKILELLR